MQVDLLLPRQREQQVERAFITLDVDHERFVLVGLLLDRPASFELQNLSGHAPTLARPINASSSARAAARSNGCGAWRAASAASARVSALP